MDDLQRHKDIGFYLMGEEFYVDGGCIHLVTPCRVQCVDVFIYRNAVADYSFVKTFNVFGLKIGHADPVYIDINKEHTFRCKTCKYTLLTTKELVILDSSFILGNFSGLKQCLESFGVVELVTQKELFGKVDW